MKIEKLTENKIRVIINSDEIEKINLNFHSIMTKAVDTQGLFFDILKKAEKEVNFHTDGCKLLVEAFSSYNDFWVFMITKYKKNDDSIKNETDFSKKKLTVKRRPNIFNSCKIYDFQDFNTFCDFCTSLNKIKVFDIKKLCKNSSLYKYNYTYHLVLSNINEQYIHKDIFFSLISEFAKIIKHSESFENKLLEHGELIIKKNAIIVAKDLGTSL